MSAPDNQPPGERFQDKWPRLSASKTRPDKNSELGSGSAKTEKALVLLVGDVMKDVIVLPRGKMRRGSDQVAKIKVLPGGAAANQAVWLASCRVRTVLVARVGAAEREQLSARFERLGVVARLIPDYNRETGILVSLVHHDGERSFFTDRGANEALCQSDVPSTHYR